MRRFKWKGAQPFNPKSGLPSEGAMHRLDKSPHSMNDYAKMSPMNMTQAMMPRPTPAVTQFAQKGAK